MLYDSKMIFEDQLSRLKSDSKKHGTQGGEIDFSLLVDGLSAEREQGITIDVAYRFFSTKVRKFIVADTPGHEEYTRNMATGASTADLAIILIDARKGILTQTRRHSFIAQLLGIKNILVAVNKMDLVGYDEAIYAKIITDYKEFAAEIGLENISSIPLSALKGDNITNRSDQMTWYGGPPLMEYLETAEIESEQQESPFRFPVQLVNRPNLNFRGFSGTIASGTINVGDEIVTLPSGRISKIKSIITWNKEHQTAAATQAVTLTLEDEIDISRGDIIARTNDRPEITDQFQAHIIWMNDKPLLKGREYLFKTCNKTVNGTVTEISCKINVNDMKHEPAKTLELNEVGIANISLHELISFDRYGVNRTTGSFIIIDRITNDTVGCGMINFGLRRAANIHIQDLAIDDEARAKQKNQTPSVLWLTGLSASGKSTIANLLEKKLFALHKHSYLLDGDNIRHGLSRDLGFKDQDRAENIRRIGEVSKLMNSAGLIVLASFISPFRTERRMLRDLIGENYVEIYIDTPLEICEKRDPKGLYKKARAGEIKNFTGIDSPYEAPLDPDLRIDGADHSPEESAQLIIEYLEKNALI
jgi:bifunctional enzyme CysN/CysC